MSLISNHFYSILPIWPYSVHDQLFLGCHLIFSSFLYSVYLSFITSVVALEIVVTNLRTIAQCSLSYYQQFNSYCYPIYCVIASSGLKYFLLGAHKIYQGAHETNKINKPPHCPPHTYKGFIRSEQQLGEGGPSGMQGLLVMQLSWAIASAVVARSDVTAILCWYPTHTAPCSSK